MNQQKIGKIIQEKRKERNMTQVELGDKIGVSNRTISKWENGNGLPDYSIINNLCDTLDLSISELLGDDRVIEKREQKKKERKRLQLFFILIIVLCLILILYKVFIIFYFGSRFSFSNADEIFPRNTKINDLDIKSNGKENKKFSSNKNIEYYVPSDFDFITDKAKSGMVMDDCDLYIRNYNNTNDFDSMIQVCNRYYDNIYNLDYFGIESSFFPFLDVHRILNKYNINTTLDLIKYYENNYDDKINVFTNGYKIRMNYIASSFVGVSLGSMEEFYYLDGDVLGYLVKNNNKNWYVVFYVGNDSYVISMYDRDANYFNYDRVLEIVSSIYSKK